MQIDTFVQVDAVTKPDVVSEAQADTALDCGHPVHAQNKAVHHSSYAHTNDGGNPSKQEVNNLFKDIPKERRCLTIQIEAESVKHSVRSHLFDEVDVRRVYRTSEFNYMWIWGIGLEPK
jgi:hypothetical protein